MVCAKDSTFFAGNKIITFRDIIHRRRIVCSRMMSQSRDRPHHRHTGVHAELCLHDAMRAVALLLITVSVRNNNGKLLGHCRLVATDVIELAGCHFIGCRWLFLAKKTLNCSF